ncbi:hypothetical protein Y032_0560g3466 [Ancylostoma ceylanicum]|uniref:Uncharacterized protein n=1 Tax=Ancylostoma ceylanicum TaxID=53326 RepID=A0A016WPT0_9BILA|nr:hypothetical protein Y032_0560g3466 [Ancylostoma ceylanicum]
MRLSGARIHFRKIFDEGRSTRHEILNEKEARPSRGSKRVRLLCDCDATSPYSASYSRTRIDLEPYIPMLSKKKDIVL